MGIGSMAGLLFTAFSVLAPTCARAASPIERIDPPSWWIGFANPELTLLVHGRGVGALTPMVRYPGVRLVSATPLENPNYLALKLIVEPTALPGSVPIRFSRRGAAVAEYDYPLNMRRSGSRERKGFDEGDVIYLAMPDRFANGDPSNDHPPGTLDRVDRAARGARHGGDLAGIEHHLDYLQSMGFTQLWLTPVLENAQPQYSYHGYSITDHYRVDPRYGTNENLRALSAAARARGIGLIGDVVVNHIGSGHWWTRDPPSPTWINGDGSQRTNHAHTSVQDPHAAEADRQRFTRGWFSPTMPDLNTQDPWLATYLIENALWWIEYADLSGLRMDTYSYSDKAFMADFTGRVMAEYPNFNIVGEEWRNDPAMTSYWQRGKQNTDGYASQLPSLMDFPVMGALIAALTEPETGQTGLTSLYERLGDDFLYPNSRNLVVFADNHDTERLFTLVGRDYNLWRIAVTLVATARGIPEFTYGTEILMANDPPRDDGDIRRDFPGGWAGDTVDAFTGRGLGTGPSTARNYLRALLNWRKTSRAARFGNLTQYVPDNGVYVYFRHFDNESVMVAINKGTQPAQLALGRFRESLPRGASARDAISGAPVTLLDELTLEPRSALVLDIR